MAYNIFGQNTTKDFSRGEAPPSDSYEWAGVALPPPGRPRTGQILPPASAVNGTTVIVIQPPKRKVWPWLVGLGSLAGLFWFSKKKLFNKE